MATLKSFAYQLFEIGNTNELQVRVIDPLTALAK